MRREAAQAGRQEAKRGKQVEGQEGKGRSRDFGGRLLQGR